MKATLEKKDRQTSEPKDYRGILKDVSILINPLLTFRIKFFIVSDISRFVDEGLSLTCTCLSRMIRWRMYNLMDGQILLFS